MSQFDISFPSLIWNSIPTAMRKAVHYAWLKCLCTPVVYLQNLFNTNRTGNLYLLNHDSQVCYLRAVLNDQFDNTSRRITIIDPPYDDPITLWRVSETTPHGTEPLQPLYTVSESMPLLPLYLSTEVGIDNNCFIVKLNGVTLTTDATNQLTGLTNQYRLPSRNVWGIQG